MASKTRDWQAKAKGLLRAEMAKRDMSYGDLASKLATVGVKDNERNVSNKIGRGTFAATFFLQCLAAIGCKVLHLDDDA